MAKQVLKIANAQDLDLIKKVKYRVEFCNPVQDADGNWIISLEEAANKEFIKKFNFSKLEKIPWKQPPYTLNENSK